MSPIEGTFSEFSLEYLALFLLSSLVRYRPQFRAHAIARSAFEGKPADDRMLSLIENFLDVNRSSIPELVVGIQSPARIFLAATRSKQTNDLLARSNTIGLIDRWISLDESASRKKR
jgi:hypothetical protein